MGNKILIVEDEFANRMLLKEILIDRYDKHITIIEAEDGLDALDKIKIYKPQLVFIDGRLPELSGYDLCDIVKNSKELSDIKLILISGCQESFLENKKISNLVDGYVLKPYGEEEIFDIVGKFLSL